MLCEFYAWSEFNGYVDRSPFAVLKESGYGSLKLRESEVPPRAIPRDQLRTIFAQLSPTYRLAAKVAVLTGMRAFEIAGLRLSQIPEARTFTTPFCTVSVRRKGGRLLPVTFPVRLVDEIQQFADFGSRIDVVQARRSILPSWSAPNATFLTNRGLPVTATGLSKAFRAAVKDAGLVEKGWQFHGLRHTYAITTLKRLQAANDALVREGKTGFSVLLTLRNLLGHRQIATTEKYLTSLALDEAHISDSVSDLYDGLMH